MEVSIMARGIEDRQNLVVQKIQIELWRARAGRRKSCCQRAQLTTNYGQLTFN
jgi:hypothetical protein